MIWKTTSTQISATLTTKLLEKLPFQINIWWTETRKEQNSHFFLYNLDGSEKYEPKYIEKNIETLIFEQMHRKATIYTTISI